MAYQYLLVPFNDLICEDEDLLLAIFAFGALSRFFE